MVEKRIIPDFSSIESGEAATILPELFVLKDVLEKSSWHVNEKHVFHHTIKVVSALLENFDFSWLSIPLRDRYSQYFDAMIGTYARKDILYMAALLHDIGKKDTILELNNRTKCPGHEERGAQIIEEEGIGKRLSLDPLENERLMALVKWHDVASQAMKHSTQDEVRQALITMKERQPDICLDILLLGKSDMEGSDLVISDAEEFERRSKLYVYFLNHPEEWLD